MKKNKQDDLSKLLIFLQAFGKKKASKKSKK